MSDQEYEERTYDELVDQGGRPLYPRERIPEIMKYPFPHWDMLRPWVDHDILSDPDPVATPNTTCEVFTYQLSSWFMFRCWQKANRGDFTVRDESHELTREYNRFVRVFRSPNYTKAVANLLAEYQFINPFHFHEDPLQQDQLTTWIEYVGYLCWRHHRLNRSYKSMQPDYDAAWKKLVESSVLGPLETEESVHDMREWIREQSELDRAFQAIVSAEAAVQAVLTSIHEDMNSPHGPRLTPEIRTQMQAAAEARLQTAIQTQAVLQKRADLTTEFMQSAGDYLLAKRETYHHYLKAQWALGQIPIIEVELKDPSLAKISPDAVRGIGRSISFEETSDERWHRVYEAPIRNLGGRSPAVDRDDSCSYPRAGLKRSRDDDTNDATDDGPSSKRSKYRLPLRRSARVAARQTNVLQPVVAWPGAVEGLPRRSLRQRRRGELVEV